MAPVHTAYRIHLSVQLLEPVHRHWTTLGIRAGTVETGVQENLEDGHLPLLGLPLCCSMTCRCCAPAVISNKYHDFNSNNTFSLTYNSPQSVHCVLQDCFTKLSATKQFLHSGEVKYCLVFKRLDTETGQVIVFIALYK